MSFIETAYASSEAAETVATTGAKADEGVLASLGINGPMFVAQLLNFAVVACIVWFLILKPLTKKMAERAQMIDESIANSKKIADNLANSEASYNQKLEQAKNDAQKMVEKSIGDAEAASLSVKTKAKQEIEALIEQAKHNIKVERAELKQEIKQETAALIITALEKILSEKITDKKDKELISEMVKKLQ